MAKKFDVRKPAGKEVWQDDNGYLTARKVGPYTFAREERSNGEKVALLPFGLDDAGIVWVVLRHEAMDSWTANSDEKIWTEITGSWDDMGLSMAETAAKELGEEANITGYNAKDMIALGNSYAVKCLDTRYHFFAVLVSKQDFNNRVMADAEGDDSGLEQLDGAQAKWMKLASAKGKIADAIGLLLLSKLEDYLAKNLSSLDSGVDKKNSYVNKIKEFKNDRAKVEMEEKAKAKAAKAVPILVETNGMLNSNLAAIWMGNGGQGGNQG